MVLNSYCGLQRPRLLFKRIKIQYLMWIALLLLLAGMHYYIIVLCITRNVLFISTNNTVVSATIPRIYW